jgi:steroid 5-alpha reductase family enzyme
VSWITLAAWGGLTVAALMFALWLLHFPLRNAAIVDFGWALGLALLGIGYAWLGGGYGPRAALIGAMSGLWGLRLAVHLLARTLGHEEEGRYQELRRQWKTNLGAKFLLFFQFQALTCVILAIPFLAAAVNPAPGITLLEWAAFGLWLAAIGGEALADAQLAGFKKDAHRQGRVCRRGLWRYSRHPNYFFEWLIWVSFALFATASPWGWVGWLSPAMILYFLLRVTGIPATEAQALRSRGEEYRAYQRTTSAFVPWFPKQEPPRESA